MFIQKYDIFSRVKEKVKEEDTLKRRDQKKGFRR
jgi:hypothetical protein